MEKKNPVSQEELDRMIEEKYRELERLEAERQNREQGDTRRLLMRMPIIFTRERVIPCIVIPWAAQAVIALLRVGKV